MGYCEVWLKDHLHMVMIIPPKYAISDVIGQLKSQSSSQLRKKFDWLEKVYWKENIVGRQVTS